MIAAAVILAAGRGSRMGGPKALLHVDGEPLVASHVRRLQALGCERILVVAPGAIERTVAALCPGAIVVGADTDSQAASLRVAMLALDAAGALPHDAVVLVTPVDVLPARADTIEALIAAMRDGASVVVPQLAGRNGHPVLARRHRLDAYTEASDPPALNLHLAPYRLAVVTDDANTQTNLNRPQDARPRADALPMH